LFAASFQEGIYRQVFVFEYYYDPLRCSAPNQHRSLMIASNGRTINQIGLSRPAEISRLVTNSVLEKKKK
jgi:hypothetical protein